MVEEVIVSLAPPNEEPKTELLALSYGLASLAFENEADQEWLIRRFNKMYDMLRETRAFQDLTKESRKEAHEEGLREGLREGLQEGLQLGRQELIQELRQTVVDVVREHFPKLVRLAKKQLAIVDNQVELRQLIVKMSVAKTIEEAKQHLLALNEEDQDDE